MVVIVGSGTLQGRLLDMLEPVVNAMDCELWGLEYFGTGRRNTLRIYIDKPGGVVLEDCERVSRQVSSVLDVEDPINSEYTLEVSSPGMARPLYTLEQFARFAGESVSLRLKVPYEGRRKFKGQLVGVEGEDIVLHLEGHDYLFPVESIDKAHVVPQFGADKQEAGK